MFSIAILIMKILLSQKLDDANVMIPEQRSTDKMYQPTIEQHKSLNGEVLTAQNNSSCAESLFEPHTFGLPSFFEDQFKATGHHPYFPHPILQLFETDDNGCRFDNTVNTFTSDFPCIIPEENLYC